MRSASLAVLLLLLPSLLAAQQRPKSQLAAYFTPRSLSYSDSTGTTFSGGLGAAYNVFWSQRFSTEVSVAVEQSYASVQSQPGVVEIERFRVQSYPVDLVGRYHFINSTKWLPYVGAGVRYVDAPSVDSRISAESRTSAEITGGVIYQVAPRWGMRFDAKQLINTGVYYDSSWKGAIGLSWNF